MAEQEVQNGSSDKTAEEVAFSAVKLLLTVEAPKASDAVQFYKAAFGAVEICRSTQPKRKAEQELPHIISAQLQLAGVPVLVSDHADDSVPVGAEVPLCLETPNVEAAVAKAVAAGGVLDGEVAEGDGACCGAGRVAKVKDPYGYLWKICSPVPAPAPAPAPAPGPADVEA
ncbi:hypothetical protein Tsubulata_012162 [Turnera subulata]|uniref:VOC domain-containing protein n=1 Tax=Turnera subulata TaxID=218843 RepID=A0A9Q0JP33_9ROSI|nr:hypothetical protein Tsubulata_012162 [Turnera subulata]